MNAEEIFIKCLADQYRESSIGLNANKYAELIYGTLSNDIKTAITTAMQTFAQQEYNRGWKEACDMGQSILSLKIKENEGE